MMETIGTEIRTFYSLRELYDTIEEEIDQYKSIADEYSQWLGLFLRDSKATFKNQEWFKNLSMMQKTLKSGNKPQKKEKKPGKKGASSPEWIPYREIMLCASEQGQAEIVFEAIETINEKIAQLEKIGNTIKELEKSGLGKGITFVAFIHDGIPEKLVLQHKEGKELAERFKYIAEFSVSKPA
ncbi:MAG: hypothetical protein ACQXXH_03985 [Candidatus Bathyarchaeia archaeon]|jgi:hypothetical protein|nr:hypothetical protein [Candidatus Bathyarchaeota archaeon A05DMB-4]MDH7594898.1 hypothetical protein [Candidatus Bathyarchaeota archaeon]